jgi:hypothetical protein
MKVLEERGKELGKTCWTGHRLCWNSSKFSVTYQAAEGASLARPINSVGRSDRLHH